jgi:hypothetical protein
MQDVTLSENAVAILRFRAKGWPWKVNERNATAYRELAAAGIMEPVPRGHPEFRFTADGWARREEILTAAEAHLRCLRPRLPRRIDLSRGARKTLARHLAGECNVTDVNREAYRELARAGIMEPVSTFIGGSEARYQFTWQGWQRRQEFQRPSPRLSASAMARSLWRAVLEIGKGVTAAR